MKKSNYILIGFLVFFFGTIIALHIDSKKYENDYIKKLRVELATSEIRSNFYSAHQKFINNKSLETWNSLLDKAALYFSDDVTNHNSYNTISWTITKNYRRFNDTIALHLAKNWAKKGVELSQKNGHINDTYANILFEMGNIKEAIEQQIIAVNILKEQNHKWTDLYINRLNRYKKNLNFKKAKVGDKFIDASLIKVDNSKIKLSDLMDNKVTILAFWQPFTQFSPESNRFLVPIYYNYRDIGLQVIGITKAKNTSEKLKAKIADEHLPWLNLIDKEWEELVWETYSINNTNNATVLIDKDGTIISINETKEALEVHLKEILNKI